MNDSSDIKFKDFMKLYMYYTQEPFSYLVNDTTLPSDNPPEKGMLEKAVTIKIFQYSLLDSELKN